MLTDFSIETVIYIVLLGPKDSKYLKRCNKFRGLFSSVVESLANVCDNDHLKVEQISFLFDHCSILWKMMENENLMSYRLQPKLKS